MASSLGRNSTNTATPTKATFAYWLKGADDGTAQGIWGWHRGNDAANYWLGVYFSTNGSMYFNWKQGGSYATIRGTSQKFRDPTAWGQHVITIDTTLATAADRVKWFYNGERITSFEDSSYTVAQNATITNWSNSSDKLEIGTFYQSSTAKDLSTNSSITDFHFCDGYAYEASSFGSVNATSGIWVGNTSPSVSYGSQGEYIKFEDSSNLGLDSSGNTNNMAVSGTLTQNVDTPDNNFATWNPLNYVQANNSPVFSNGNTKMNGTNDPPYPNAISTLGIPKSGKYYAEFKNVGTQGFAIGICDIPKGMEALRTASTQIYNTTFNGAVSLKNDGSVIRNGTETNSVTPTIATNDIVMIAYDADNGAFYAGRNGTWGTVGGVVGVPTSGSSKTGAIDISAQSWFTTSTDQGFLVGSTSSGGYAIVEANFGNGYFGTTAVTSAGTGASTPGTFEYDVPTGYQPLTTKGLNL